MPRGPDITVGNTQRRANLKRYGMSLTQFTAMFRVQNGKCAICGREIRTGKDTPKSEQACVDHNHRTGKVRALLCNNCNAILGFADDSSSHLEKAVAYLRYYSE